MILIDGSYGEGGGQIVLRRARTFSILNGWPVTSDSASEVRPR